MNRFHALIITAILGWLTTAHDARAQGSLTPPGAPAPTMKSLDQVEARTAITNTTSLVTISQPGSYYLTHNLTVSSGDAIDITTNNVTLDLNGFTISSTVAGVVGNAISLVGSSSLQNISIKNGNIQSGITNNGSGNYSGSGFSTGIAGLQAVSCRISGVSVYGCWAGGICLSTTGTSVEFCKVQSIGGQNNYGIVAAIVSHCTAMDCGGYGAMSGNIISDSEAEYRGTFSSRQALMGTTINNCHGVCTSVGYGIWGTTVNNSVGETHGFGIGINAYTANNCSGTSVSGAGLAVSYSANNCYGYATSGTGISISQDFGVLNNCNANGSLNGIVGNVNGSALINCTVTGCSSNGIVLGTNSLVRGCMVISSGNNNPGTNGVGITVGIRSTV
jgi:hypothetical protein